MATRGTSAPLPSSFFSPSFECYYHSSWIMAESGAFGEFEAIFGEAKAEWENGASAATLATAAAAARPFLYYVHAVDASRLEVVVSDFHSFTWGRIFTVTQLEDIKVDIGIGGPWSEFVDYLITSVSSGDVKLILNGLPNTTIKSSVVHAKLIALKSKGMPHISLSLNRLMSSSANDAISNLSIALFKALKSKHNDVVTEQRRSATILSFEKCDSCRRDLIDQERNKTSNAPPSDLSDKAPPSSNALGNFNTVRVSGTQQPSGEYLHGDLGSHNEIKDTSSQLPSISDPKMSMKVCQLAATVYRRAKGRRVFMQDTGHSDGN